MEKNTLDSLPKNIISNLFFHSFADVSPEEHDRGGFFTSFFAFNDFPHLTGKK